MKKSRILTLLFSLFVLSFSAQQFDVSAEIRPRFESRHGYKSLIDSNQYAANFISQRSRINFDFSKSNLKMRISMQNVRVWGDVKTLSKADMNNSLHEGWAQAILSKKTSLKMGRQEIIYDDHRIFGTVDWAQQARSHDAFIFKFTPNEKHRIDIGFAMNANGITNVDTTLFNTNKGAEYKAFEYLWYHGKFDKVGLSFLLLNTNNEFLDESDSTDIARTLDNLITVGPRVTYKKDKVNADISAYLQTGKSKNTAVNAMNIAANLGMKVSDNFKVGAGVEYLSGKAQNDTVADIKSFKPLFGTNHKFNGLMDYFYVGNHGNSVGLMDINFLFAYKKDKLSVKMIPHLFSAAADVVNNSGDVMDKALGTELDFVLGYKVSEGVTFNAGYSMMFATETMQQLKGGSADLSNNWGWVMFSFKPKLFSHKK